MMSAMIEPGWFMLGLAVVSAIISAATAIAIRPSRKEVNEMIDLKVDAKIDNVDTKIGNVEKDMTEVKADVKTLLQRTARMSTKRK